MTDFHGWPTIVLENQFLRLEALTDAPRIVRFQPRGHQNLFADLGRYSVPTPLGDFFFRGGHRLWHAPEAMPRTYVPEEGAQTSPIPNGLRIEQPAEPGTNIAKSLEIRLNPHHPQVIIQHELRNDGLWQVELAPWALTMFRQGGMAIFPQPAGNIDAAGLLPNRQLAFWPYTQINDPRLKLRDDFILLAAHSALPPVKFGYFNPAGWQAYYLEGLLFVKHFDPRPGAPFPDGGCNTESYCNHQFIELESLGPLTRLQPGETILHIETWEVYDHLDLPFISPELRTLLV